MEGLAWGPDAGATYLHIGDEYNYMYQMWIATGTLTRQWDVGAALNISVPEDKGIESLTYSSASDSFLLGSKKLPSSTSSRLTQRRTAPRNAQSRR